MKIFSLTLAAVAVAITLLPAQAQQQQPPPQNPPAGQPPAGQRAGGGGRGGRGGIQIMTLTAPWQPGGVIPEKHSQAGREVSPALSWDGAPDTTVSFALVVHDVNAATQPGTNDVLHWMVWNIPATERSLPEGVPQGPQAAERHAANQPDRPELSRPRRAGLRPAASLCLRALRARLDDRSPAGRRTGSSALPIPAPRC